MGGGLTSHKGNGNGHKGRPYGFMLLLVFGAALLGVLVLHKLRETRIFNLLVEGKNRQLLSLQTLLQKEREYNKEMRRKVEETKAKLYYFRNQKMELDRRLMETISRIDSLKNEQKAMESALEEKSNEIKQLRDKDMNAGNENPHVIALTATLKQKEAEIEELKHRLNPRARVRSVSTVDSSNLQVNMTVMGSMDQKGKTGFIHEEGEQAHDSSFKGYINSSKGQDWTETQSDFSHGQDKREGFEDGSEKRGGQLQKLENLGANAKNADSEDARNYGTDGKINHANMIDDADDEQEKSSSFKGQLGKPKNHHRESDIQKRQPFRESEEVETDEKSWISRLPGRIGHLSISKGKRWRILARNRSLKRKVNSGINAVENMTSQRVSKEYKDDVPGRRKEMDDRKANYFKHQNSEDNEGVEHRKMSAQTSHQVEGENATERNHDNPLAVAIEETGLSGEADNYTQGTNHDKVE
ncbi:hypothetical protein V6N13_134818 [Hibiscus sabdariffa]|uniref:Micronuclear linker histone polyprotein-like protein n=1 Tax=Hibiscus sabdariffa TaxID=183260 RepID=A0ABR2R541_9ROSI